MDPYIEACGLWEDFHSHLIEKVYEQLADAAPDRYLVRTGKREYLVLVESEGKEEHPFLPDVSISTAGARKKSPRKGGTATADLSAEEDAPVTMRAFIEEEHRESFVEILENVPGYRLVTAIEVLSPSNKRPGTGRDLYLRKRQSLLLEGVGLVEIDLLRSGDKMPMLDKYPVCPYTLLVARAKKTQLCQVWPAHFKKPLPAIPVPLLKGDADLTLRLQPLIESIYRRSRYEHSIAYDRPLSPPLDADLTPARKKRADEGGRR
jgi:hypothetical protein